MFRVILREKEVWDILWTIVKDDMRENIMLRKHIKNKKSYYVYRGDGIVYRNKNHLLGMLVDRYLGMGSCLRDL